MPHTEPDRRESMAPCAARVELEAGSGARQGGTWLFRRLQAIAATHCEKKPDTRLEFL